jgi:hypothetical protein
VPLRKLLITKPKIEQSSITFLSFYKHSIRYCFKNTKERKEQEEEEEEEQQQQQQDGKR